MIASVLHELAAQHGDQTAVIAQQACTYGALRQRVERAADEFAPLAGRRVGVALGDVAELIAALAALDQLGALACVFPESTSDDQLRDSAATLGLAHLVTDRSELAGTPPAARQAAEDVPAQAGVLLFTSGTSGRPKPALHTWASLSAAVQHDPRYARRRWLLAYEAGRFAGIQVWLQSLLTGGCLVVPTAREPSETARCLLAHRVEYASGTPTFWRMLLAAAPPETLKNAPLRQITLGGEAVDQPLLDALSQAFPSARISHIYASTEMGACFSVSDRCEGFPVSYLDDPTLPCQLKIDGGELWIRSTRSMTGYFGEAPRAPQWFATGDLVEARGDRVYFLGRRGDAINVGGAKVLPAVVEAVIRRVPGVKAARVFGIPSPVVGQLAAAEVASDPSINPDDLRRDILQVCRQHLARHQVPARIDFRDQLSTTASGDKLLRASGAQR